MNLIHVCFPDNLLMIYRDDKVIIQLLLQVFNHFSEVSGLHGNLEKRSLYIMGGIPSTKRWDLKWDTLQPWRITIQVPRGSSLRPEGYNPTMYVTNREIDCEDLLWATKFLLYSGRVQLIKSVLLNYKYIGLFFFSYQRKWFNYSPIFTEPSYRQEARRNREKLWWLGRHY